MRQEISGLFFAVTFILSSILPLWTQQADAGEVSKGQIPKDHLATSYKQLPWGVMIWDVPEAVEHLKNDKNVLWVDTRPQSFFNQGTVKNAVPLVYGKKGHATNTLTPESLTQALTDKGLNKNTATIAFFCQGPACHRSYNAAYTAVTEWGYSPDKITWFRAGYPHLLQEVKANAKLKRRAKRYLSDAGIRQL
ncbi:rhodanese-like domain-containing protein [Desulfobulbus rhabdoformis]|uniref:rhodanese-like domain-containing protein n=1 Tax=Desulfobulbus rhabdoformis TaxID=34032 RepID=UPI001963020B|nr:rhodanese-like domain-containing protein [Desulfobulbus rhabdoformis]MBM9613504.1 rhodanese-like domain-containing protein [Desulfobulbus rhabdoformis]